MQKHVAIALQYDGGGENRARVWQRRVRVAAIGMSLKGCLAGDDEASLMVLSLNLSYIIRLSVIPFDAWQQNE